MDEYMRVAPSGGFSRTDHITPGNLASAAGDMPAPAEPTPAPVPEPEVQAPPVAPEPEAPVQPDEPVGKEFTNKYRKSDKKYRKSDKKI